MLTAATQGQTETSYSPDYQVVENICENCENIMILHSTLLKDKKKDITDCTFYKTVNIQGIISIISSLFTKFWNSMNTIPVTLPSFNINYFININNTSLHKVNSSCEQPTKCSAWTSPSILGTTVGIVGHLWLNSTLLFMCLVRKGTTYKQIPLSCLYNMVMNH